MAKYVFVLCGDRRITKGYARWVKHEEYIKGGGGGALLIDLRFLSNLRSIKGHTVYILAIRCKFKLYRPMIAVP